MYFRHWSEVTLDGASMSTVTADEEEHRYICRLDREISYITGFHTWPLEHVLEYSTKSFWIMILTSIYVGIH